MAEHPIEALMTTAMESIKEMVDVNTIVGDAVQSPDGTVIIPISRVSFGFASGGGEYYQHRSGKEKFDTGDDDEDVTDKFPFAGGSGAGVSINPVAFMVVGNGQMKLLPVNINSSLDKILDIVPELINRANDALKRKMQIKKEMKVDDSTPEEGDN
jgi:sporulation protein YtfJ